MTQHYLGVKRVEAWPEEKDGKPGYAVKYEDGYQSWSPEDVFERAYYPMGTDNDGSKITQDMVDRFFTDLETEKRGEKTTVGFFELANGFEIVEASSCCDPKNYDDKIGTEIIEEKVKDRVWHLLGFVLQWANRGLAPLAMVAMMLIGSSVLAADRPPTRPPIDPRFVTVEAENPACDCENCKCVDCKCGLDKATDIDEKSGELRTFALKTVAPLQNVAIPPRPQVEPVMSKAEAAAVMSSNDGARMTEAYRRLTAAGYTLVEKDEVQLCDTCPNGFQYTGKTFLTAEKSYDEGQIVGSVPTPDPTPIPVASNYKASAPVSSPPVYSSVSRSVGYSEPSCGSDYSYATPVTYSYSSPVYSSPYYGEASCGSEGFGSSYGYAAPVMQAAPVMRGGLFQRLRARFRPQATMRPYSAGYYSAPYTGYGGFRSYGAGPVCVSGNCG